MYVSIVNYLSDVANMNIALNFIMHIIALLGILAIFCIENERIKSMMVNSVIFILIISVMVNGFIYGNPFHAITFAIMLLVTCFALFNPNNNFGKLEINLRTFIWFLIIIIGLWYPEFVKANMFQLLLVSPLGVIPCPTLLITLGLLNLSYPKVYKLQYITILFMALLYGIIGTFALNVYLDTALLVASIYGLYNLYNIMKDEKKVIDTSKNDDIKI